jgi:hypothetical protein
MPMFSVGEIVRVNGSDYRFRIISAKMRRKRTGQGLQYQYVIHM